MKKLSFLLFLFIIFICISMYPESGTGRIISVEGEVKIDPLGTGAFEDARVNDTIYMQTIIETGYIGKATVIIAEKEITLSPGSSISGEELYRETRFTGFEKLKQTFHSLCIDFLAFIFPREEIKPGGFKDVNAAEAMGDGINWQGEKNSEQENHPTYAHAIAEKDYATALALLDEHHDLSVSTTEIQLLKGFCHFQLRHYKEAYEILFNANTSAKRYFPVSDGISRFYTAAMFQKCLAAYFTGRENAARKQLAKLKDMNMDEVLGVDIQELVKVLEKELSVQ